VQATRGTFTGRIDSTPVLIEPIAASHEDVLDSFTLAGARLPVCDEQILAKAREERMPRHLALAAQAPCFTRESAGSDRLSFAWLGARERESRTTVDFTWKKSTPSARAKERLLLVCENAPTRQGEAIYAVGEHERLGGGNISGATRLEPVLYPHWARVVEGFAAGTNISWRCAKVRKADLTVVEWQSTPAVIARPLSGALATSTRSRFQR
jgi:hypothetical protein